MELYTLNRAVRAAEMPLEKLAGSEAITQEEKVAEVSRQFEAVLLRQILSQAQKPLFKTSLMESSGTSTLIYQDLITEQLADRISKGGTFGFAKVLEKQLAPQTTVESAAAAISTKPAAQEPPVETRKYISPAIQPGKRI